MNRVDVLGYKNWWLGFRNWWLGLLKIDDLGIKIMKN